MRPDREGCVLRERFLEEATFLEEGSLSAFRGTRRGLVTHCGGAMFRFPDDAPHLETPGEIRI